MANTMTLPEDDVTSVATLVGFFEEAESNTTDARKYAERDRDYYDNRQWTADEEAKLRKRGQPIVTFNAIQRKVDYMSGLERQTRRDPKGFPRTPKDEGSAQAATDALRYVCDDTQWDNVRSAAWDNLIVEGQCAVIVTAKEGRQGIDPDLHHIGWDRFFADPHSARVDFEDARYLGFITWDDLDNAKEMFPGKDDILDAALTDSAKAETYDDKPKWGLWSDAKRRRVRYCEIYYLKGRTWYQCIFTKTGHLVGPQPSPYLDEDGKPENPIKAVCLRRDRDNNTYGDVRVMIGPQDDLNKRHSKALHLITMRQSRVSRGAGVDADEVKRELAKPDGSITADKDEFEILPTNDMAAANLNMMQISKAFIDGLGANAALAGKNEADMSGRAILAQQQGGMVEIARAMDRLRMLSLSVYRSMWARIRQFWDAPRWIRITDDERNLRFVGLNQPVTVAELAQKVAQGDEQAIEDAHEFLGKFNPQLVQIFDAALRGAEEAGRIMAMFIQRNGDQVVKIENPVAELDVDIVIDEGVDTPTVQAEQFDTLAKVLPTAVNLPPPYLKALIMASALRNKDQLLDEVEKAAQGPQIPPEVQQQMEQMQQAIQQLGQKFEESQQALQDKSAETQIKAFEAQTGQYEAETDRLQALKPEQQQAA